MPAHAAQHDYSDTYTGGKEFVRGLVDDLKRLIRSIGTDRFKEKKLLEAQAFGKKLFGAEVDAFSVMWINGLLNLA